MPFYFRGRKQLLFILVALFGHAVHAFTQAPTHLPRPITTIDANINGFYEYLPRNYASGTDKLPLIIFLHGNGERSNTADPSKLNKVLDASLPFFIEAGDFPESFTVNSKTERFIVLSPQFIKGIDTPTRSSTILPSTIQAFIDYAIDNYRVDKSRVYLCGMSMGGGAILDYLGHNKDAAEMIAAVAIACPAGDLSPAEAVIAGSAGVPLVLTHNDGDQLIFKSRSQASLANLSANLLPSAPAPIPVYFSVPSADADNHNAWARMFEVLTPGPANNPNVVNTLGMSVYQWLLGYRSLAVVLPVTWKSFTAQALNGSVTLDWTVSDEKQLKHYEVQRSIDAVNWSAIHTMLPRNSNSPEIRYRHIDPAPLAAELYYRIVNVDHDGKFGYSQIRSVRMGSGGVASFSIFPNPFRDRVSLQVMNAESQPVGLTVYNALGLTVFSGRFNLHAGVNTVELKTGDQIPAGNYFFVIRDVSGKSIYTKQLLHSGK